MIFLTTNPLDFSQDKLEIPGKVLQIFFVCALSISNVALVVVLFARKKCRAFTTARYSVQLSLAVGGLLSALFTQVINTILRFDMVTHGLNCETIYLAQCFFFTFLPLMYAMGLMVLCVDFILKFKTSFYKVISQSKVYAFFCAIFPWAIAFLVSCPLTLIEVEWDLKCAITQTIRELQTSVICCVIVPVGLVLIIILAMWVAIKPAQSYTFESFDSPMTDISKNKQYDDEEEPKEMNGSPSTAPKRNGSTTSSTSSPPPTPIFVTSSTHPLSDPSLTNSQSFQGLNKEKWKLLSSLILFFIFVVPYGVVFIYVTENYTSLYPMTFVYMVETRVFFAYFVSVLLLTLYEMVIPLVWICSKF